MRISVLVVTSLLAVGCSSTAGPAGESSTVPSASSLSARPSATSSAPSASGKPSAVPTGVPAPGAEMSAVIGWIEAGTAVDAGGFHTATREGQANDLGADVAFVTAGGINCMTDKDFNGALACLTHPAAPLPQPADTYGHWVPGWVDFEGMTAAVGSIHGDPGRFNSGTGPQLKDGQTLAFGEYRCRADGGALTCVNYAHQTGLRLSDAGVVPFGCLKPVTPPAEGFGQQFGCKEA